MKKKWVLVALIVLLCGSSYLVGFTLNRSDNDSSYEELDLFGETLSMIQKKYVEEKEFKDLIYGALSGMASSLDSYSQFLKPEDYRELLVETEGKFGGLGIEITMIDGLLTIVSPIEGTPAEKAGLKPGDVIIKIDGAVTKGITLNEAVKKLRGEPGEEVTVTVFRESDRRVENITIVRDIIKIKDIRESVLIAGGIGYIKLTEFREKTARDLDTALKNLADEKMKAIILDLRNNPGGLLLSAVDVASRFLGTGEVIVSTKSRKEEELVYKSVPYARKYLDVPMVVLINKGSASGSEIVAAALKDNKRAVLVGEKSFGKASVQSVVPLSDGSALRFTTAKYYTPSGESIHEKGVEPDIIVESKIVEPSGQEQEDVFAKIKDKATEKEFDYTKDYQLVRAVDLIKGLLVLHPAIQ
ncbi:MAG: S41 family peptidase [Candidatus Omnitrophica bacterium]|nr:S41 family peptidase [Candidatus Omnitrophota bacterium]